MIVDCFLFTPWTSIFKPYLGRWNVFVSVSSALIFALLLSGLAFYGLVSLVKLASSFQLQGGAYLFGFVLVLSVILGLYEYAASRFFNQWTGLEPDHRSELFTNGIYPAGCDFVNGAHPFFYWRDLLEIELNFAGLHHQVKFTFAGEPEPYVWRLYSEQIAELSVVVAKAPEMQDSLLARVLAEHRLKLASGQTEGTIAIKAEQQAKPIMQ